MPSNNYQKSLFHRCMIGQWHREGRQGGSTPSQKTLADVVIYIRKYHVLQNKDPIKWPCLVECIKFHLDCSEST